MHRECPFCMEPMRRDASVCPHCRHPSDPWRLHDGHWWRQVDGSWVYVHFLEEDLPEPPRMGDGVGNERAPQQAETGRSEAVSKGAWHPWLHAKASPRLALLATCRERESVFGDTR
jgi:hypothetical protein